MVITVMAVLQMNQFDLKVYSTRYNAEMKRVTLAMS